MNQGVKRAKKIRDNPKDVRFVDACAMAVGLGFLHTGGSGSHKAFTKPGEPVGLNFQNRAGKIPPYQARQLIDMMDRYENDNA